MASYRGIRVRMDVRVTEKRRMITLLVSSTDFILNRLKMNTIRKNPQAQNVYWLSDGDKVFRLAK